MRTRLAAENPLAYSAARLSFAAFHPAFTIYNLAP
jgi:hypothetical protein